MTNIKEIIMCVCVCTVRKYFIPFMKTKEKKK